MEFELISSSFCGACSQTRAVLEHVTRMLPTASLRERNVADDPTLITELDLRSTPTVIVRDQDGGEFLRAEGVPSIQHLLVAAERAMTASSTAF
ncbi:MAG: thioredoxin family protein [Gulosibacter sp.]|uniref:thioredoxin family protein n=1 Tax=Gulosibacter sp. TaxID=2817531 RepID=UPI003F8FBDE8